MRVRICAEEIIGRVPPLTMLNEIVEHLMDAPL
jgi:hypothetical protein